MNGFFEEFDNSKSSSKTREKAINQLTKILNYLENEKGEQIIIKGDPVIQIGTVSIDTVKKKYIIVQ